MCLGRHDLRHFRAQHLCEHGWIEFELLVHPNFEARGATRAYRLRLAGGPWLAVDALRSVGTWCATGAPYSDSRVPFLRPRAGIQARRAVRVRACRVRLWRTGDRETRFGRADPCAPIARRVVSQRGRAPVNAPRRQRHRVGSERMKNVRCQVFHADMQQGKRSYGVIG